MKLNVSVKFFLMFFLFAAVTIGGYSFYLSHYFSRVLIEREFTSFKALSTSFLSQTESSLHVMDDISINIFYSNLIQDSFDRYVGEYPENRDSYERLLDLFIALNGANLTLPFIAVYSNEGDKIGMGNYTTREKVDLTALPWVNKAREANYHKYLSRPYESNMMQSSQRVSPYYISLYREFCDEGGRAKGFIETAQYADKVFEGITAYRKRTPGELKVYVFNEEGDQLYPYGTGPIDRMTGIYYLDLGCRAASPEAYRNPYTGERELLHGQKSSYTGWTYVCVQDLDSVLLSVRDVSRPLFFVTMIVMTIIIFISWYLSSSITRPIRELLGRIHATSIDTLSSEKNRLNSSYNEFDELNDAFYSMNEKIKRSMDELLHSRQRESESRYLALQSQINPHFYYNSLSSIIALTEAGRQEDVVRFCTNLSRIMRYVAAPEPKTVPLRDEIEYAEKYLFCMKVRYQSSLTYRIGMDEELLDEPIPKLIIQPLIENALKHGTDCPPPWHIEIGGEKSPEGWIIRVSDNGRGFPREILERINRPGGGSGEGADGEGGLGLPNVCARWRIFAGDRYYFRAENREPGCSVTLGMTGKEKADGK